MARSHQPILLLPKTVIDKILDAKQRAEILKNFCELFSEEFFAEYNYLQELSRGNLKKRHQKDVLAVVIRIGWSLLHLVPAAGSVLAGVLPAYDSIMSEIQAKPSLDIMDALIESYNDFKDEKASPKANKAVKRTLIDPELIKLLASSLAVDVARRYEFAITNLLDTQSQKTLEQLAREGARRVWIYLLEGATQLSTISNKDLLGSLFHERKITNNIWNEFVARWNRLKSGTNLPVRSEVIEYLNTNSLNDQRIFACTIFYDATLTYKTKHADLLNNGEAKYGYAWIKDTSERPEARYEDSPLPAWIKDWENKRLFKEITKDEVEGYLNSDEVKKAKEEKKTTSFSLSEYLYKTNTNYVRPCKFICKQDLTSMTLTLAYCNFEDINFSGSKFKDDLSGTNFKHSILQRCTFENVYTNEDALDFSLADLSGSKFICDNTFDKGLKAVNFSQTKLRFVDFGNILISLEKTASAEWYKPILENIRYHDSTLETIDALKKLIAEQEKAILEKQEIEAKKIHDLVNEIKQRLTALEDQQTEVKEIITEIQQSNAIHHISNPSSQIPDEKTIASITESIKSHYTLPRNKHITQISGASLDIEKQYANISMIAHAEQKKREKSALDTRNFIRKAGYDEIFKADSKQSIEIQNLFSEPKKSNRILILGRAGIGKTTLCKKIIYDYLNHDLWKGKFKQILWIPLRNLKKYPTRKEPYSLGDVLYKEFFLHHPNGIELARQLWRLVVETPEEICFVLDGLDEVISDLNSSSIGSVLNELINYRNVIVTSRSQITLQTNIFDLELEAIGFNNENIQKYLSNVLATEQQTLKEIQHFLEFNPLCAGLANIPIQLDILCYSWNYLKKFICNDEPITITQLYQAITYKLWLKYIDRPIIKERLNDHEKFKRWLKIAETEPDQLLDLDPTQIDEIIKIENTFLKHLAFLGIKENRIQFNYTDLRKIADYIRRSHQSDFSIQEILQSPFLTTQDNGPLEQRSYYFLHLTFQEFFAAKYLVSGLQEERGENFDKTVTFIGESKYQSNMFIPLWFTSGLLEIENCSESVLTNFWNIFTDQPGDLVGIFHWELMTRLIDEAKCADKIPQQKKWLEPACEQFNRIAQADASALGLSIHLNPYLTKKSNVLLTLEKIIFDKKYHFSTRCEAVVKLGSLTHLYPSIIKTLFTIVKTEFSSDESRQALHFKEAALSALGETSLTPTDTITFVSLLLKMLNHEPSVNLLYVFQKINKCNYTNEQLSKIIEVILKNLDSAKSREAFIVLRNLYKITLQPTIMEELLKRLDNREISEYEIIEIIELSKTAATSEIIKILLDKTHDKSANTDTRKKAIGILIQYCKYDTQSSAIISSLLKTLDDDAVSDITLSGLYRLGTIAKTQEVIEELIKKIFDEKSTVDTLNKSIDILLEFCKSDAQHYIIEKLFQVLKFKNSQSICIKIAILLLHQFETSARSIIIEKVSIMVSNPQEVFIDNIAATIVLGYMGSITSQNEIIIFLNNQLKSTDLSTQFLSVGGLYRITNTLSQDSLNILTTLLNHGDVDTRKIIISSIFEIRSKSPELQPFYIDSLVKALSDKDEAVLRHVIELLEDANISNMPQEISGALLSAVRRRCISRAEFLTVLAPLGLTDLAIQSEVVDILSKILFTNYYNKKHLNIIKKYYMIDGARSQIIIALNNALKDEEFFQNAIKTLQDIGKDAAQPSTVKILSEILLDIDNNFSVRNDALETLNKLGSLQDELILKKIIRRFRDNFKYGLYCDENKISPEIKSNDSIPGKIITTLQSDTVKLITYCLENNAIDFLLPFMCPDYISSGNTFIITFNGSHLIYQNNDGAIKWELNDNQKNEIIYLITILRQFKQLTNMPISGYEKFSLSQEQKEAILKSSHIYHVFSKINEEIINAESKDDEEVDFITFHEEDPDAPEQTISNYSPNFFPPSQSTQSQNKDAVNSVSGNTMTL